MPKKISTSAAKAKGRRLQDYVRDSFRAIHKELEDDDIKCAIMGESGTDIKMSPAARKLIPFDIECKNQEKMNVWASIKQCETNCNKDRIPLLVFKRNHTKPYACIEFETLLRLISRTSDNNSQGASLQKPEQNT